LFKISAKEDFFNQNVAQIKSDLKHGLEEFDKNWVAFEEVFFFVLIFLEIH